VKVLFLTHSFPRDPDDLAGSFILRLAVALREESVSVEVLAPHAAGLPTEDVIAGVPVTRFRYAPRSMETLAYTGTMAEQVRDSWSGRVAMAGLLGGATIAVAGAAHRRSPSLLHAHWWFPSGAVAMVLRPLIGIPYVVTMHGSDVRLATGSGVGGTVMASVLRRAAASTAVSTWLAHEAMSRVPGIGISVEPMPVATDLFSPGDERIPGRLLFVGRLNSQKGIAAAVGALASLPDSVTLDVIGDGEDESTLRKRSAALGVEHRIFWHGRLPQAGIAEFYRRAELLVMPSREEGLGLVAVEAHLSGCPVVAFDSGGVTDVVIDGVTGAIAASQDAAALAAAVMRVLKRPDRGRSLGEVGRARALDRFSPSAVAARYAALYRDALATRAT
jgi:glycosyltransferase involved in cell wall biosynthesis